MPQERGKLQFRSSLLLSDRAEYYMIFPGKLETQILPKKCTKRGNAIYLEMGFGPQLLIFMKCSFKLLASIA